MNVSSHWIKHDNKEIKYDLIKGKHILFQMIDQYFWQCTISQTVLYFGSLLLLFNMKNYICTNKTFKKTFIGFH